MRSRMFARRSAAFPAGIIVSTLIVACATAADRSDDAVSVSSDVDAAALPSNDVDAAEPDSPSATDAATPCSSDGWCKAPYPGPNITGREVAVFEKRAFALLDGDYIRSKIGEWTPDAGWTLIKGNDPWLSPTKIWAPDEDTVFYTAHDWSYLFNNGPIASVFGVVVVRGRRPVAPATEWTFTTGRLPCNQIFPEAAVGGTTDGNVYVATCGKIYRLDPSAGAASDGGADAGAETLQWIDEGFVDVDQAAPIDFYHIGGTGPDDLWFAGGRVSNGGQSPTASNGQGQSPCTILVHKTTDGYRTVLDGIPLATGCSPRDDLPMVRGRLSQGIFTPSKNRVLGATEAVDATGKNVLLNVALSGDQITIATTRPPAGLVTTATLGSAWGASEDEVFVLANYSPYGAVDRSTVIHGQAIWGDSPSWGFSHLAINAAPNSEPLNQIRGTSNQNLWVVGRYNAYHKSTAASP